MDDPTASPGCTLRTYSAAKRLPLDFLKACLVSEITYQGFPALRIPYLDPAGSEIAVQFRIALSGDDRFRWKTGSKPCLYGLQRLREARERGFLVLVEGPSDVQTLWLHGFPALGLPSATGWKEPWAEYLDGIPVLYANIEPDRGGKTVLEWLSRSTIQDRVRLLHLGDAKDPSGLYLNDPAGFRESFQRALGDAKPWEPPQGGEGGHPPGAQNMVPLVFLVRLADVQPEEVRWLWHPYIPLGKLTLLQGDPGVGKSWVSLSLATAVSLGRGFPGAGETPSGNVLLLTAEDDLEDTVRPRLDTMGADSARVFSTQGPLTFDEDGIGKLAQQISEIKPLLVIVDPIQAYAGGIDFHKANEVRTILAALAALAAKHGCAILLVCHLTKGARDKAIYRGIGSIDFMAACRSALLAGLDPDDKNKRAVVHIKSNLAPLGDALAYEVQGGHFFWAGPSDLTAGRILAAESAEQLPASRDEAVEFLRDRLVGGPRPVMELREEAEKAGIAWSTIKRAKNLLGIKVRKRTKAEGGEWEWSLPGEEDQEDQEDHVSAPGGLVPLPPPPPPSTENPLFKKAKEIFGGGGA